VKIIARIEQWIEQALGPDDRGDTYTLADPHCMLLYSCKSCGAALPALSGIHIHDLIYCPNIKCRRGLARKVLALLTQL